MVRNNLKSNRVQKISIKTLCVSFVVLSLLAFSFEGCKRKTDTRLVVGWMTVWATAGQIVETLDHTNITELYGSKATFRNFLYGPNIIEAGLGGDVDAMALGIVPVVSLLANNEDWTVVCRLIDFSTEIIAREGSGINTFADIKGKKLGVPFGSGAHPHIILRMEENGMTTSNTELINVSPAEAIVVLQQGGIDALGTWEPTSTTIESRGIGRVIDEKRHTGFVVVRKSIVEKNPEAVVALIKSFIEANWYVVNNRKQTDEWFANRSNYDLDLLSKIRIIEPNLNAQRIEDISVTISPDDIALSQQFADYMFASDLVSHKINFKERVNFDIAKQATDEIRKSGSKITNVKKITQQ